MARGRIQWQLTPLQAFIDYFPDVLGTIPEKMIFNELARRGVNFYFAAYFGDIPFTQDTAERYRPDFMLPDYNIIIEVHGLYWHSLPGKWSSDYYRAALLDAAGWSVRLIPDTEIVANPIEAINKYVPELLIPQYTGFMRIVGDRPYNPSAPIIARILRRPKILRHTIRSGRRRRRPPVAAFRAQRRPLFTPKRGPVFSTDQFDMEYLNQIRQYGQEWRNYLATLETYFTTYPDAGSYYPEEYNYWLKWRNWWSRFRLSQ